MPSGRRPSGGLGRVTGLARRRVYNAAVPRLRRYIFNVAADSAPAMFIALPMFAVAVWLGMQRGHRDIGLYTAVMALATFHVAHMAIWTIRAIRDWLKT